MRLGKAVLVANNLLFIRGYDRAPLIQPILYKTAAYWVIVFMARVLERRESRSSPLRCRTENNARRRRSWDTRG